MFGKIFGNSKSSDQPRKPGSPSAASRKSNPADEALMRVIEEKKKTDPLIGAKIGGKEIFNRVVSVMKTEQGVHIQSLLCALGALAGYSCQANLRAQAIMRGVDPNSPFTVIKTKDGKQYYFGDPLNQALAEDKLSVWSLAAAAAQGAGLNEFPDIKEIFERTSATLGTEDFGIPKYMSHAAGNKPIEYLKALWPPLLPIVKKTAREPVLWPVAYGLAIQEAIDASKTVIAPAEALSIVMEAAIPMSKVDLTSP